VPEITAYVDEWTPPDVTDNLTTSDDAGVPWWIWLLLALLLACCLLCCCLYCCLLAARKREKKKVTYHRRGGFQKSLAGYERRKLGMSFATFAKSMVGMEGFVPPLASSDESASTSREGAEQVDEEGVVIVSEDGLEIGYAYPSWHLGVKRHVLGTSMILGMNRHLLGTQSQASGYDFADSVSRNSSEGVSPGGVKSVTFGGASLDAMSATTTLDPQGVQLSMLRPSAHHLDIKPVEKPAPPEEKPPPMP